MTGKLADTGERLCVVNTQQGIGSESVHPDLVETVDQFRSWKVVCSPSTVARSGLSRYDLT